MIKEKLVAPPEAILPPLGVIHKKHPLLELARTSSDQATSRGLDIRTGFDANQVVVVGQRDESFEYFVGKFISSDVYKQSSDPDWFIQQLLKGTPLYLNDPSVKTFDGSEIPARVRGLIFPQLFDDSNKQNAILAKYLNPDKLAQSPKQPQIFTFSSAFNPALEDWPFSRNPGLLEQLPVKKLERFVNDFMFGGLEVLAHESDNKYVRQTASRLHELRSNNQIAVNVALDMRHALTQDFRMPGTKAAEHLSSQYAVLYLPNLDYAPANIQGFLVMPHEWIIAAEERPVVALAHLLYSASLARDHYFGKLEGTQVEGTRWGAYEISHAVEAKKRAGSMVAQLLMEATNYDHRRYGINLNLDSFCRDLLVKYPFGTANNHHYDDPSQGKFKNNDNDPRNGPYDNFSRSPLRPPSLSGVH